MLDCGLDIFKGIDKDIVPDITNMFLVNGNGKILYDNYKTRIGQQLPEPLNDSGRRRSRRDGPRRRRTER